MLSSLFVPWRSYDPGSLPTVLGLAGCRVSLHTNTDYIDKHRGTFCGLQRVRFWMVLK